MIIITIEGGLIQSVMTDNPDLLNQEVLVVDDVDEEGYNCSSGVVSIPFLTEQQDIDAFVHSEKVVKTNIDISSLKERLTTH